MVYSKEDANYDDIVYSRPFRRAGAPRAQRSTRRTGALTGHVAVTRPDGREQAVVAWATGSTNVHVTIYNGTNWDNGSGNPYADAKVITGASNVFAATYEQNSGQLLIAVGSGSQMKYYLWDGSSWVIDGSTQTFTNLTQTVQAIRMASKPGAGEIALMATDGTNCVGLIWDGSANAWGTEQKLNADSVSLHYAAAVTYMQTGTYGGRALFVWDETYVDGYYTYHRLKSREWTGSVWQSSTELLGSEAPAVYRIELAADPGSDDVLIVYQFSNGPIWAMAYTGFYGSPKQIGTTSGYGSPSYNRPFNAIFESASGHSGHFLIVFSDSTRLKYWHFTSISLMSYTESTIGASDNDCRWIDLARTADGATIHLVAQDDNSDTTGDNLIAYTWNNTSWTSQGNLTTGLLVYLDSSRGTKPFALTLQPPAPALTQAHTRWRNNDGNEATGTVAVSAYSGAVPANSGSSVTVSHTVSGSNRLLLVGITLGSNTLQTRQATTVTWNGAPLTLVGAVNHVTLPSRSRTEIWRLVNPDAGTYNVVVNLNGSLDSTGYQAVVSVMSFTGVDQTTPLGTYASSSGTAATQSVAISSAANELAFAVAGAQTQLLTNSGNTEYWNDTTMIRTFAAGGTKAGASSVTMTWTKSTTSSWTMSGVSIKPAAAATWAANEDTQITGLTKSTTRRLRFLVSNTGLLSSVASYKLQVAQTATCGSGTYSDVTTSTSGHWAVTDTAYYTNGDATTNVSSGLTDPGGYTFQAGQTLDTSGSTGTINLNAATFTEIEFAVQATDNAILGANYCFRLYDATAGTAFDTYTNYGQATLQAMSLTQAHYRWRNDNGTDTSGTPAVAVAAAAVTGTVSGSSTLTLSNVQVPAGTNRLLMVGVSYKFISGGGLRGRPRAVGDLERPQPLAVSNIRSMVFRPGPASGCSPTRRWPRATSP